MDYLSVNQISDASIGTIELETIQRNSEWLTENRYEDQKVCVSLVLK